MQNRSFDRTATELVIVGGRSGVTGGVEHFCERAKLLFSNDEDFQIKRVYSNTSYMTWKTIPTLLCHLARVGLSKSKFGRLAWVQYGNFFDLLFIPIFKMRGSRVIVTPHLGSNWRSRKVRLLALFSSFLLKGADYIAYIAESQILEIPPPSNVPWCLVPTLLPEDLGEIGTPADIDYRLPVRLIHACRLSKEKGTLEVLRVANQIALDGLDVELTLAGPCDKDTNIALREFISNSCTRLVARISGPLDSNELFRLLCRSEFLLHPSTIDSYPLILLEGIACGVYPIGLELPGVVQIAERYCGSYYSQSDYLAGTIDLIRNRKSCRQKALAGRRRVMSDFDRESVRKRYRKLFLSLS